MSDAADTVWSRRRAELNHGWLKGKYIPALDRLATVLSGRATDDVFLSRFVLDGLRAWEEKREEAVELLADYDQYMSPANYVTVPPLACSQPEVRRWLTTVVTTSWKARTKPAESVRETEELVGEVQRAYERLLQQLSAAQAKTAELASALPHLHDLRESCRSLAECLAAYPRRASVA